MDIFFGNNLKHNFNNGCCITIGNFDGIHKGHYQVLKKLKSKAKSLNLPAGLITFEPYPMEYFCKKNNQKIPYRLTSLRDKIILLNELNLIDFVWVLKFNKKLANYGAEDFINEFIIKKLNTKFILIGDDFKFGHNRNGDYNLLKSKSEFITKKINSFYVKDIRASSSYIRKILVNGDIPLANFILGHDYTFTGRVIDGKKLGRKIDCPTANIYLPIRNYPLHGVYVVFVKGPFGEKKAVASFGFNPTVTSIKKQKLEVHILDFNGNLYGQILNVKFKEKLRDEKKFNDIESLKEQIQIDIIQAREWKEDKI